MRRIFYSFLIILLLIACSPEEDIDISEEDDTPLIKDVKIPNTIFTSEKNNSVIAEEEMKQSIKIYLDSSEELDNASYPFEEFLWDEDQELHKSELDKLNRINKLVKENDENFSNYILNNTLPEGYQEESERISRYITASNEFIHELNETIDNIVDEASDGSFPDIDMKSIKDKTRVVNGREQGKIEEFLDKENIDTKAFGRGD
ncbi:NDxxF motif lipoprotein [Virgibacillus pantothenticus]|uniref:NDxxF motif lipoprotein n=1 Tax=Virgibacillus pantothenticus TaxID=1473 RepID=UPI0025B02240|nr:NDxxF motif lipoprotein [Virgibacillus pantothenticus]